LIVDPSVFVPTAVHEKPTTALEPLPDTVGVVTPITCEGVLEHGSVVTVRLALTPEQLVIAASVVKWMVSERLDIVVAP
jgi:hypothetical protein